MCRLLLLRGVLEKRVLRGVTAEPCGVVAEGLRTLIDREDREDREPRGSGREEEVEWPLLSLLL